MADSVEWAAGVIEGEGYIGTRKSAFKPRIGVEMTDLDVVARLYAVFDCGLIRPRGIIRENAQQTWFWRVYKKADVLFVLVSIRPYMSARRTAAIDSLLTHYPSSEVIDAVSSSVKRAIQSE